MKLFQMIAEWLRKRGWLTKQYDYQSTVLEGTTHPIERFVCSHGNAIRDLKVAILGVECEFKGSTMCPSCAEKFLNQACTLCASCKRPVFPGTSVGQAWSGALHPFTHLTRECCDSGGLYCGLWGEGRLITLHELHPKKYPAGTRSVVGHTFSTGEATAENVG